MDGHSHPWRGDIACGDSLAEFAGSHAAPPPPCSACPAVKRVRNRLDTLCPSEIACTPFHRGFPAGGPGGRDADSFLAAEDTALWEHHLPEGRLRSGAQKRQAKSEIDQLRKNMLIYLDANVVQYCADYGDFVFGVTADCPASEPVLRRELLALRELVRIEQFGAWEFATSPLLLKEIYSGKPTSEQLSTYTILEESFSPETWPDESKVEALLQQAVPWPLRSGPDRKHLAAALAMGASWFLTNDARIIEATPAMLEGMHVARPSECVSEIGIGLFLK